MKLCNIFIIIHLLNLTKFIFINSKTTNVYDYIIKFDNEFYKKLGSDKNIENYKKIILEKIENKNFLLDKNTTSNNPTVKRKIYVNQPEILVKSRIVKFYISLINECNVFINDTLSYELRDTKNEFIDHIIPNTNALTIDPQGVYSNSDGAKINLFVYNRRRNFFKVLVDNLHEKRKFNLEYDYFAMNLLKSEKSNNSTITDNNTFIWKFYNENINNNQNITIEIYFAIDKLFEEENATFSSNGEELHFNKSITQRNHQRVVKYQWSGVINSRQILVLNSKFPIFLDTCGVTTLDLSTIILQSIFILVLIVIIYILAMHLMKFEE